MHGPLRLVLPVSAILACLPLLLPSPGHAQLARVEYTTQHHALPDYLKSVLSPGESTLFTRLLNINIESAWGYLRTHGYPRNFINQIRPVQEGMRFAGRARTMRYLPDRQDLRERFEGLQLNYRSAEDCQPGDVLVYDCGGEREASPTGDVTSLRAMLRGCAGVVVDGSIRDVPGFIHMGLPLFTRGGLGHASAIRPLLLSWDYQVPVRIGDVTVVPGDYLVGAAHGILVIPASLVEEVLAHAEHHALREDFQRQLLLEGRSMIGVYPPDEETLRQFEAWLQAREQ